MMPDKNVRCPATGFAKSCREIVAEHDCPKFVRIAGTDPQTGERVDKHGCVDGFLPMLLIEVAKEARQGAAATESFRNETMKANAEQSAAARAAVENILRRDSLPVLSNKT